MPTATVYPDANPETTSVDGWMSRNGVDESFATIRAGAGTTGDDTSTDGYLYCGASSTSNQFGDLRRFLLLFDTSAIGAGATISAATLSLWCLAKANGLGSPDIHVVSSNPVANTSLGGTDYANFGTTLFGTTSFGSVAYASVDSSGSAYTDITLNGSGLAAIALTGITKLGLRNSWDQSGTFGGVWVSGQTAFFQINLAENASGTAKAPKLVVTYTVTQDYLLVAN